MPIEIAEAIVFRDECSIQECETLLATLQESPAMPIDLRPCRSMHTALLQVLIAAGERQIWGPDVQSLRELLGVRLSWDEPPAAPLEKAPKAGPRDKKERN